jgi:uncharacterized protein (DUF362 family)
MKRREFLTKTGQAVVLVSIASETGLITINCQSGGKGKAIVTKPDFEVAADPQFPRVALARNEDHARALCSALDAIGGIRRFVKKGEKVLLKPNAAWDRIPEQGVNTNPVLIGEMVRQCKTAGAADVMITDYGPSNPLRVFTRSGIKDAVEKNGGRIIFTGDNDFLRDDFNGRFIDSWPVLKYVFEVDRLINMPIAKHHGLVYGTASMKNFFGAIGGNRNPLHDQIDQAIVDLAAYFRPTLTVVDATRVLMRAGPQGGSFDDVETFDSVICSTDQVAADSRACEFLGLTAKEIKHVVLAAEQGLGQIDYRMAGYKEIL